jgi:ABC-2 type transport system permease protein
VTARAQASDAARRTGGAARLRRVAAQTAMELRLTLRNGESLLVAFGIPLGMLVFFSLVDVLPHGDGRPVDFLLPGVLALSVMSTAMVSLGIATGFERHYLVLKRLGATPLRRGELITAKALTVVAVEVVQVIVLLGIGIGVLGFRPSPGAALWLLPVALAVGTAAFAGLGLAMAGRLRAVGTLAAANTVYLFLLLVGGIAFPLERLPERAAAAARLLPSAPLAGLLRAGFGGDLSRSTFDLGVLALWAIGSCALAARVFRWE